MTSFSIHNRETNQNLHTYEFMMGQYKKLAKVTPVIQTQNNQPLEEELKRISNSIKSIESRQNYEIKSPPWTILWFRILRIF